MNTLRHPYPSEALGVKPTCSICGAELLRTESDLKIRIRQLKLQLDVNRLIPKAMRSKRAIARLKVDPRRLQQQLPQLGDH